MRLLSLPILLVLSSLACTQPAAVAPVGTPVVAKKEVDPSVLLVTIPQDPVATFQLEAPNTKAISSKFTEALWVVDHDAELLYSIEPTTAKRLGEASTWPRPHDVVLSPDGKQVWVGAVGVEDDLDEGEETKETQGKDIGQVWGYSTSTLEVVAKITPGRYPGHLAIRPDGRYLFASLAGDDQVAVIDLNTNEVVGKIPVGTSPRGLAVSPDGKILAVACSGSSTVSLIDLQKGMRSAEISLGARPTQVAFSPDGEQFYVIGADDATLYAVDIDRQKLRWKTKIGLIPGHIVVSPDNGNIYVTDALEGTLWIVDPKKHKEVRSVPSGKGAHGLTLSLDSRTVFVSNGIDGSISEIERNGKLSMVDSVPGQLRGIALGPAPQNAKGTVKKKTQKNKATTSADAAQVRLGRSVFKKHCDSCHPSGKEKVGPQVLSKGFSRRRMINQIRNGSDIMPPYDKSIISDEELEAILAYLMPGS